MTLDEIREIAAGCQLCNLWEGRIRPVFDKGNPDTLLMICGMVPAYDENKTGWPFVGRAGNLLDKILDMVGLTPDSVYITNLVKCFLAPGLDLEEEWINSCLPYVVSQIGIVKPSIIITLGVPASTTLLGMDPDTRMKSIRGRPFKYSKNSNIDVVPTYHPSFLLRGGGQKSEYFKKVIEDFEFALFALAQKREA